jgi:hypothetical protein
MVVRRHHKQRAKRTRVHRSGHGDPSGGLSLKKGIVQLEQGQVYVFRDGPLEIQGGTLQGEQVVVLLQGNDSTRLVTQAGASIVTSAPT